MKRRISFIFAFALLCMSSVVAQVASGTCGDNLTWVLTEEGELIVEGTGDMYDYYEDSSGKINHPWLECRNQIKTITIGEGVTSIGNTAFRDCIELTSISLNDDLKHIGVEAFRYCGKLTAIDFPESLTSIANSSFFECRGLLSVTIPEGITNIDFSTFYDCSSLKSLILPSGMTSIGGDAFKACHNLTEIVCKATTPPLLSSSTFSNVSREAFVYVPQASISAYESAEYWSEFTNFRPIGTCGDNLTWRITLEDELIVEGTGAMTDYSYGNWAPWYDYRESILSINIGEGVTTIANQTFRDCTSLTTVTIPACVTTIGEAAFYNCPSLATANMAEDSQLESIGYNAFLSCKSLTAFTIPATVTSIGEHAFHGCEKLPSVTIPANIKVIESRAFQDCRKFNTITIPAGVTTIKDCAFYGCENLEAVIFPENSQLTTIGTEAFYNCQKLGSIIIPASVTTMGEGVFKSCTGLISATIPAGVTTIEYETFESCSSLTNVTFPENSQLTTIGTDAFRYCDNLTSVIIPDNSQLTTIGFASFLGCSALTSITLPASLTSLDMGAFKECTSLTSMTCNATTPPAVNSSETFYNINRSIPVYVPASAVAAYKEADYWKEFTNIQAPIIDSGTCGENLTWRINGAYELTVEGTGEMFDYSNVSAAPWQNYKSDITSVDIKEGVTSVGSWAFSQCAVLTDVAISESVTRIGGDAFRECPLLEEITLPEGLTELGTGVFLYCDALKSVTVPEGVTKIGSDTFEFCPQLSSITFPSSLTEIGPWALKGAYSLTSITCKAATPPSLGNEVFSGVSYDITVYVPTSSVEAYKTAEGWNQFANIQPIILASGTCGDNLTWKLTDEGELTIEGTGAMTSAPWRDYTESIKVITIKEGVTTICDRAFEGCYNIVTVTIPKGVTEVGMDAFWDCTGVLYLSSIPVSRDHFMEGGFSFSRFTKVVISDDITEIGDMAFSGMRSLTEVVLPDNLQRIGYMAFSRCHNITTITIPEGVTTIGDRAFDMCAGLTSIVCKTATPPACGFDVFTGVDRSIPLFVSLEAINEYQSAEQWKEFTYFVGTAKCGENLTCELWPDGKLIVKGEGEITTAPWDAYREQIKEVVLEEVVTGIADGAFADLENLASITSYAIVPPVCGEDAFAGIENITPVYVPADVVEEYEAAEGWEAFTYLSSMNSRVLLDTYATYAHAEDEEFDNITYVRNFTSNNWETLYLPFEIDYWDICEDFDVAYIYDTHQYDTDDDGVKDETVIEIFKIKDGILEANYPYLIRAKEAGEKEIVVTDATLYATEEVTLDCSSIFDTYTFTTTYSSIPAGGFEQGKGYYTLVDGMWLPASKYTMLGAFRFYLKVESRNGSPVAEARSIRMRIVGEGGDDSTTGIDSSEIMNDGSAVVYDLQGRRVAQPAKGINIMKMKDGSVGKVMVK